MRISRRKFLQAVGVGVGASALNVLPAWAGGLKQFGAVMPNTAAAQQWLVGLQRNFRAQNANALRALYRTTPSHALTAVHKLGRQAIAGWAVFGTPAQYPELAAWAKANGRRIWFSTLGANVEEAAANTISLNLWQANYALGRAAKQWGGRAFLAASAPDAGYDALYALQAGFEYAGGTLAGSAVSHTPNSIENNLPAMMRAIAEAQPDMVLAAYHGLAARQFMAAYQQAGFTAPLVAGGTWAELVPEGAWTWAVRGSRRSISAFTTLGERTAQTILNELGTQPREVSPVEFELRQVGSYLPQPLLDTTTANEFLRTLAPVRSGWLMDYGTF